MLQNKQRNGKQTKVGTSSQEVQGAWQGNGKVLPFGAESLTGIEPPCY